MGSSAFAYYCEVGNTNFGEYVTGAIVTANTNYHLVFVSDRDGTAGQFYVNGVAVTTTEDTAMNTSSLDNAGSLYIGQRGNSSSYFSGEMYSVRCHNHALTATEVKELYSGGSVPYKYKGANQTEVVTNGTGFTGAGGATEPDNWWTTTSVRGIHTITNDGGSHTACLLLEVDSDPTADPYISHDGITVVIGKRYRFSAYYKNVDADSLRIRLGTALGGSQVMSFMDLTATSWTEVTGDFTATTTTVHPLLRLVSDGAGEGGLFDNISIVQIGAVAEYDGSGIASDKWFDKSGNDLHGTVTGATVENAPSGDDGLVYEEGTWTPAFTGGSSAGSYSMINTVARYTRIGRVVHVACSAFNVTELSAGSGAIRITGLPFTVESTASSRANVGTLELDNFTFAGSLSCTASAGNTYVEFRASATGTVDTVLQVGIETAADSDFAFNVTYTV